MSLHCLKRKSKIEPTCRNKMHRIIERRQCPVQWIVEAHQHLPIKEHEHALRAGISVEALRQRHADTKQRGSLGLSHTMNRRLAPALA